MKLFKSFAHVSMKCFNAALLFLDLISASLLLVPLLFVLIVYMALNIRKVETNSLVKKFLDHFTFLKADFRTSASDALWNIVYIAGLALLIWALSP